tara:strand:+ start:891 stop:1073 length:183 start_codon:yes stop_codon:yes gene_type:complete
MAKDVKEYVLKIGYDPISEEIKYIQEYIENSKATLTIDDKEYELEDELADYLLDGTMGIT